MPKNTIPKETKAEILRRVLPPNNENMLKVSKETGVNHDTIRHWKSLALKKQAQQADNAAPRRSQMSSADKFQVVIETSTLNEHELGEYARRKGLYTAEILAWREACINANGGGMTADTQRLTDDLRTSEKEKKALQKEIIKKDKTIAEVTALLVLSKKANAIWGESEDA